MAVHLLTLLLSGTHLPLDIKFFFATFKTLPNLYEDLKAKAQMVCLVQGLSLRQQRLGGVCLPNSRMLETETGGLL